MYIINIHHDESNGIDLALTITSSGEWQLWYLQRQYRHDNHFNFRKIYFIAHVFYELLDISFDKALEATCYHTISDFIHLLPLQEFSHSYGREEQSQTFILDFGYEMQSQKSLFLSIICS
jgi:hypothetical protein